MKTFEIKGKSYVLESDVMELQNENELFSAAIFSADMREIKLQAEIDALKKQNAELRATLQAVVDNADYIDTGHQIAVDALAKLKESDQ